ncbi:Geraniol 8-hydroxylase [Linum grandiflorum]
MLTGLLCLLAILAILFRFPSNQTPAAAAKLPPGPSRLPIIGNLHNLLAGDKLPHQSLAHLAQIHGPLMSLKLGQQVVTIVASSPAVAKEILQNNDQLLSNRHLTRAMCAFGHHEYGMSLLPVGSSEWRNLRKLCSTYLFATQKLDSNQDLRRKKIQELLQSVGRNASEGKAVDIGRAAFQTSINTLSTAVLSLDLTDHEGSGSSEDVVDFKEARGIMDEAGKPNFGDYFPVLGVMDLQGIERRIVSHSSKLLNLFGRIIDERLEKRQSEAYISANDMLDTLLDNIGGDQEASILIGVDLSDQDLFAGGIDTMTSTVEWAMAEMLRNPLIFAKARDEIDQTIGKGNCLLESDVLRLLYLQAIIKETFRLHPASPLLIPRNASADVEICGFTVPKGAQILVNLWAMGRDPDIWNNPTSFMPERFMGSEIDFRGSSFELIPFGGGRRICPGLPWVMRMLPLILGSLVHEFDWTSKDGVELGSLDMKEKFGITLQKAKPLFVVPMHR